MTVHVLLSGMQVVYITEKVHKRACVGMIKAFDKVSTYVHAIYHLRIKGRYFVFWGQTSTMHPSLPLCCISSRKRGGDKIRCQKELKKCFKARLFISELLKRVWHAFASMVTTYQL